MKEAILSSIDRNITQRTQRRELLHTRCELLKRRGQCILLEHLTVTPGWQPLWQVRSF